MKFLTKDELFENKDGKYVMDGQIVGFVLENKPFAARLTISNMAVYLCQTRIATEANCPDQKGMKFTWCVEKDQVEDYYMFQDDEIVPQLVDLDRKVAEYYRDSEHKMAEWDKQAVIAGMPVIKEVLEKKRKIAQAALDLLIKQSDDMSSVDGANKLCETLQKKATERCEKTLESWNK